MITTLIHTIHTPPGVSEHIGTVGILMFVLGKKSFDLRLVPSYFWQILTLLIYSNQGGDYAHHIRLVPT